MHLVLKSMWAGKGTPMKIHQGGGDVVIFFQALNELATAYRMPLRGASVASLMPWNRALPQSRCISTRSLTAVLK